jgi:putative ABC transport system permease protein
MAYGDMLPGDETSATVNARSIKAAVSRIDAFFLPTLSIQVAEGRNFINGFAGDSANAIIVNETFLKEAGLKNAAGKQIILTDVDGVESTKIITGVVADYHYNSLKEKVSPLVLEIANYQPETIWVKIKNGNAPRALAAIQKTYRKLFPGHYYEYTFLEEDNAAKYAQDERWKLIITWAACLAVFICCTGLFGLAHFAAQQRVKEIGIRKVLGASVTNIMGLLSKNFLQLVVLALAIASPIAWYCMNKWLQNFAYRTNVGWQVFAIAGFISIFVALFTVSLQAARAAKANPVKSLRTE